MVRVGLMVTKSISTKIKKIKLIIFDVDGVLTDGKKTYDKNGQKFSKSFGDLDFTAIKILMSLNFKVIWLSGDKIVNEPLAKVKNIPFYTTRLANGKSSDKVDIFPNILKNYRCSKEETWFIGDDLFDLGLLRIVGLSSCPSNASFLVKKDVDLVHKSKSGENIASEVLELIFLNKKINSVDIDKIYKLQAKEATFNL
jgi:3-deoxy-D-manno-octulosonate 8-phosphate phosphatase (KDO 8-P phosphatase)